MSRNNPAAIGSRTWEWAFESSDPLMTGINALCPDPCPEVLQNSDAPCPAVSGLAERHRLTPRERQALWFVCLGLKNRNIAVRMGVSLATARLHLRNLHRKTRTADKVDLVLQAWHFCIKNNRNRFDRLLKPQTYRKR